MRHGVSSWLLPLVLAACPAAQDEPSSVGSDEARQFWSHYIEAELAADVEALVRLHAQDAHVYPADGSVVRGREDIRAMIGGYFPALRATAVNIDVEDVWMAGDTVLHTARFHEVFADPDGTTLSDGGRFFVVLVVDTTGSRVIHRLLIQSTAK